MTFLVMTEQHSGRQKKRSLIVRCDVLAVMITIIIIFSYVMQCILKEARRLLGGNPTESATRLINRQTVKTDD
jgi:hypothetical protein